MRAARRAALAVALAAATSCGAPEGTIVLSIVTAPDSDVMEDVERIRLTLSDPPSVTEAERDADGGFELDLDVVAEGQRGRLTLEGFDADGELVAVGHAGPLPIASITVGVAVYVAPPDSLAEAPVALEPARTEIGAAPLVYGAILAGGRDRDGVILDSALIYNVHSHEFQLGETLPGPRASPAVAALGPDGPVYLFGGRDERGDATRTAWSFDASTPPAGIYADLDVDTGLARERAAAAPLGRVKLFVTGDPPVEIDPFAGNARALAGAPPLRGTATATEADGEPMVLATGADDEARAARWRDGGLEELDAPAALARRGHGAAGLPGGDVLIAGGAAAQGPLASAVRYAPDADTFEVIEDFLATPREGAAVARAKNRLLIAGGTGAGGEIVADAEIFDAETLEPLGAIPMVSPRTEATAVPFENGQILIAGGTGEDGDPVAALELFTPAPRHAGD